jgi:8-oxo-dGTP pyrophosphatase MutT (NUDIX family)
MKKEKPIQKINNKIWTVKHEKWGEWQMEWSDNTDFENLEPVIGVEGFVFDENGKFCIIKLSSRKEWMITGGKTEKVDKNFEETLIREVDEEADLEIKDIKRVGYVTSYKKDFPEKKNYSLRYLARVKKIKDQTIDPAYNEIPKRKFIFPEEFNRHCGWAEFGDFQMKKVLKILKR